MHKPTAFSLNYLTLIHSNPHFIAVSKPAYTICQDERWNPASLSNLMRSKFPELYRDHVPPFHDPKGVHRLDAPVTGCVLFGTSKHGTKRLAKCFRDRTIRKVYLAVLRPSSTSIMHAQSSGTIESPGMKTEWRILRDFERPGCDKLMICLLRPFEGRTHQLRIHAADYLHAPILFDMRYPFDSRHVGTLGMAPDLTRRDQGGWIKQGDEGLALHCVRMTIPFGLEQVTVSCEPPQVGIWRTLRDAGMSRDTDLDA